MRTNFLNQLFTFFRKPNTSQSVGMTPPENRTEKSELSRCLTFGKGDSVILMHKDTGEETTIIHENGDFADFPGVDTADFDEISEYLQNGSLAPRVQYRTFFSMAENGGWYVTWCVQPDGRYWEDEDGFGGETDKEINLHSFLSDEGRFTQPFKIHSIGILL